MPVKTLPPPGKYFQKCGKRIHAAKCDKSCVLTKVIDTILDIDSIQHGFVILKGLLQSELLKQHMVVLGVVQSLSNSALYKHRCLGNIKKLYKSAGKCYDRQKYKVVIESTMVSNPEIFIDNSPMSYE